MGHPTSFLSREIDMSDAPKKETVRSPKQQERNAKLKKASALLKNAGLKAPVTNISAVIKMKNEGATDAEIIEAMRAKQANNNATRKAAKSAPKTPKATTAAEAATATTKKNNNTASTTSTKVKSTKQADRNTGQKDLATKFKNQGLKFYGAAVKYYTEQKKAGKSNNDIFAEIKAKPNLQQQTRTRKNATAKPANVVAPAPTKMNGQVTMNKGVPKGSWVCEKCRYVGNNTTRKNNNKNNSKNNKKNNNKGNNSNAPGYWYNK
jgi:hypothetical protein